MRTCMAAIFQFLLGINVRVSWTCTSKKESWQPRPRNPVRAKEFSLYLVNPNME